MLSTSKNVLFPGHNHLLTTGADDHSLAGARVIFKVLGRQHRWSAGGYDLKIGYFLEVDSMVANRWIVVLLPCVIHITVVWSIHDSNTRLCEVPLGKVKAKEHSLKSNISIPYSTDL